MRQLNTLEKSNLKLFVDKGMEVALIEPTATGLKKCIIDATSTLRILLKENHIHDYKSQGQGINNRVHERIYFIDEKSKNLSEASLYRPNTKNGDPRIWPKKLPQYAKPNEIICLFLFQDKLHVTNISKYSINDYLSSKLNNPFKEILSLDNSISPIAKELLTKLKKIAANGPHETLNESATGIGETLESLLGIKMNSSKKPDYKGIELKSHRGRNNRLNLFAQVADWSLSKFKSSKEILNNLGYKRGEDFKLYCTVSTQVRNSQGLKFRLDDRIDCLIENSNKSRVGDFAVWRLEKLQSRLLEKHKETFWIKTDSIIENENEYFDFQLVNHTRNPILTQFDLLLGQGIITMDHLIKRNIKNEVREKGQLFKIKPNSVDLLFHQSIEHKLK